METEITKPDHVIPTSLSPLNLGHVSIPAPIVQGGMGVGISLSSLASAVTNAGGLGVIACAAIGLIESVKNADFQKNNEIVLRREIRRAKELTNGGPIGVNIMVVLSDYEQLVKVSVEEGADVIFSGAGLPLRLLEYAGRDTKVALVPIISSGKAAEVLCRSWSRHSGRVPDGFVVEGPLAGGHLGFTKDELSDPSVTLESRVIEVVNAVKPFEEKIGKKIPVIAAGGIFDGSDIARLINIGASAVQLGTRFVLTEECDASDVFKEAFLKRDSSGTIVIDSPVGMPGRALENEFIKVVKAGKKVPFKCPYHCIKNCDPTTSPYCIAMALDNARRGKLENGLIFSGSNVDRLQKIVKVRELVQELVEGADLALAKLPE